MSENIAIEDKKSKNFDVNKKDSINAEKSIARNDFNECKIGGSNISSIRMNGKNLVDNYMSKINLFEDKTDISKIKEINMDENNINKIIISDDIDNSNKMNVNKINDFSFVKPLSSSTPENNINPKLYGVIYSDYLMNNFGMSYIYIEGEFIINYI